MGKELAPFILGLNVLILIALVIVIVITIKLFKKHQTRSSVTSQKHKDELMKTIIEMEKKTGLTTYQLITGDESIEEMAERAKKVETRMRMAKLHSQMEYNDIDNEQ